MSLRRTIKFIFDGSQLTVKYTVSKKGSCVNLGKRGVLPESKILEKKLLVKKIVIDESMKKIKPISLYNWFKDCFRCEEILGLENLNGEKVKNMGSMFENCYSLKAIVFGDFSAPQCIRYDRLFFECTSLQVLDAPNLKFLTKSIMPFYNCNNLNRCNSDISVISNLPLYDNRIMFVFDSFDEFGNRITKTGKTANDLFLDIINQRKSKQLKLAEKELKEKFFKSCKNSEISAAFNRLLNLANECCLAVSLNWNTGDLNYTFLVSQMYDKTPRRFVAKKD